MSWLLVFFGLFIIGSLVRWTICPFPYSGQGKPPMYGDYEAQRHWMEITLNLPLNEWYVESVDNDLSYWGLDYPPLSAFHSYGLGLMMRLFVPESVELYSSRGHESQIHLFWMRASVYMSDILLPSILLFYLGSRGKSRESSIMPSWAPGLLAVVAPPFILIDYAHFQYNSVSLGLTTLAILSVLNDYMSLGGILFTLAVNHKQMSLYHALPFFIQMTGFVLFKNFQIVRGFRVGILILSTLGLMWLPFGSQWSSLLTRIFPLKRGVYEDKVGTFWFCLDRIFPIKQMGSDMARICALVSLAMLLPPLLHQFRAIVNRNLKRNEETKLFLLSLLNSSLILFLFSYHVHEKSILLPALPATLLIPHYPLVSIWFISISTLSLYPLLLQEGSHLALLVLTAIFIILAAQLGVLRKSGRGIKFCLLGSLSGYIVLVIGTHLVNPPTKLPHLFPTIFALYSFLHFAAFCAYFQFEQFKIGTEENSNKYKHVKKSKKQH